jgi:hypothetical protein
MEVANIGRSVPLYAIDASAKPTDVVAPANLIAAVQAANKSELFGQDRELSFTRDTETRRMLIQIKDRQTGEVVQQIPPKELLELVKTLRMQRHPEPQE